MAGKPCDRRTVKRTAWRNDSAGHWSISIECRCWPLDADDRTRIETWPCGHNSGERVRVSAFGSSGELDDAMTRSPLEDGNNGADGDHGHEEGDAESREREHVGGCDTSGMLEVKAKADG